jgi:hypothetical protein
VSALLHLLNPPKIDPPKGRIVRLINMRETIPSSKPSTAKPQEELSRAHYERRRLAILAKRKEQRAAGKAALARSRA